MHTFYINIVIYLQLHQAHPAIDQTTYIDAWKKYHKTACTSLPEDEHLEHVEDTIIKLKH